MSVNMRVNDRPFVSITAPYKDRLFVLIVYLNVKIDCLCQ